MDATASSSSTPSLAELHQRFVQNTPYIVRIHIIIWMCGYALSWIIAPTIWTAGFANIPYYTIIKLQLYRLLTSSHVPSPDGAHLLNVLVLCWFWFQHVGVLERSLGSTSLLLLIGKLILCINIAWCAGTLLLSALISPSLQAIAPESGVNATTPESDGPVMMGNTKIVSGPWPLTWALLALEGARAGSDRLRPLLCWQVPAPFYALALLGLFAVLSWNWNASELLGWAMGFAIGRLGQQLEPYCMASVQLVTRLEAEAGWCHPWTRKLGWVAGHAALGDGSWSANEQYGMTGLLPSFVPARPGDARAPQASSSTLIGSVIRPGQNVSTANTTAFTSSGRPLGGASTTAHRRDIRSARLSALEKARQERDA